jgi:predicted adenine nucleotide alpha hydrolase (AANH) superfamily ATPase
MENNSVLVHCCCAHCSAYTIDYWRRQGYEVSGFWYNPNIHPYSEHQHRLEAMQTLADKLDFPLITTDSYDIVEYFHRVTGHESQRCQYCFRLRLGKTAKTAVELGFGGFTSSLLISPHQKHGLLPEIGNSLSAEEMKVKFLYADLRKRYSDSRHITKPMALYRQQYCGCVYSEWERYAGIKIE